MKREQRGCFLGGFVFGWLGWAGLATSAPPTCREGWSVRSSSTLWGEPQLTMGSESSGKHRVEASKSLLGMRQPR